MINRSVKELLQEAYNLEESGQFDEAIAIYEEIALMEGHPHQVHSKLTEAWMLSHLKFFNEVIAKHPESKSAYIEKIKLLIQDNRATAAVQLCTQALERFGDNEKALVLHTFRRRAAIKSGRSDYLVDDFLTIWRRLSGAKARLKLLEDMLSASDIRFVSVFRALAENSEISPAIQKLFQRQAENLEILKAVYETELSE